MLSKTPGSKSGESHIEKQRALCGCPDMIPPTRHNLNEKLLSSLQDLTLQGDPSVVLKFMSSCEKLPRIRVLELPANGPYDRFLQQLGVSLHHLTVDHYDRYSNLFLRNDSLQANTELRTIRFQQWNQAKGGQTLNDLISSIKSVHVEEIYIALYADVNKVACFVDYGAVIAQKAAYTWEGVDDALVSASFPVLRKVRLVCAVWTRHVLL